MITVKGLRASAQTAPCAMGVCATLRLDHDRAVVPAIRSISNYFREDARRGCVELIISGQKAGYLSRAALPALSPGIGDADHATLLGQSEYTIYTLRCPICDYHYFVMSYDEDHPHICKRDHLGAKMELKSEP